MNSRFLLPATVATALHALVFLSGHSTPPTAHVPEKEPGPSVRHVFVTPDEMEPERETTREETPTPLGNPDALRPFSEEPAPKPSLYVQEIARERPTSRLVVATVAPGPFGVPGGAPGEWTDRPVVDFRNLDKTPRTRSQVAPTYPANARMAGLTGQVMVEFVVDEDGRVSNPRVLESTDSSFNEATLRAVARWRFEPGRKDGRPVRFRMVAPVVFNLDV